MLVIYVISVFNPLAPDSSKTSWKGLTEPLLTLPKFLLAWLSLCGLCLDSRVLQKSHGRFYTSPMPHVMSRRIYNLLNVFYNTIFVSSHMYSENLEGTQVILGSMNMGYVSVYPTLPGLELPTCIIPSGHRFHEATVMDDQKRSSNACLTFA